ncbi:MAG: hypothetical protein SWQ30_08845 [Thermodesulfobacteriota bacterium]|nr:hypothetical protein [Thermodesulfobacteriota bacterium]
MITEETQPVFGLIAFVSTSVLLLRSHSWLSISLFVIAFIVIACGVLSDYAHDNKTMMLLPEFIFKSPYIAMEERFDVIGIGFLCLSVIFCFRDPILDFMVTNVKATVLMLLASGMITAGNSFLHYQYNPGGKLQLFALVMTICGFVGFMFLNKLVNKKSVILKLITENFFYFFLFSFFVVLPSIHGMARNTVALFVWLPFMFFLAVYLWRSHPEYRAPKTRGKVKIVLRDILFWSRSDAREKAVTEGMTGGEQSASPMG